MARELKLGLNTGYWSAGPPPGVEESIAEAERLGFDSVWTAEAYGSDVLTPLAWWGSQTERIKLGTGIVQMSARQPAATAMAAMTLDHLSGGRFILGLGVSGPQVVEGWYGQQFAKPLARTREYVKIVRDIVKRGERVTNSGPHYPLPLPNGTGLASGTAAGHIDNQIKFVRRLSQVERLSDYHPQCLIRKVTVKRLPVDLNFSRAGSQIDAGGRCFAPPGSVILDISHS